VVRWWCVEQREPAPLFFTKEELKNAADVFAIEILDMKHGRRVLYGTDVVAEIEEICARHEHPYLIFRDPLFSEERERSTGIAEGILRKNLK